EIHTSQLYKPTTKLNSPHSSLHISNIKHFTKPNLPIASPSNSKKKEGSCCCMDIVFKIIICLCLFLSSLISYPFLLKKKPLFQEKKNNKKKKLKLPPGSMGWPYFGETLQLYSQHPNHFFSTKHQRYGEVFKTSILGCSCVMLASPEAARFVLVTNAHLFKPTYPKSKERLIGKWALFFHQGEYHSNLKKLVCASRSRDRLSYLTPRIQSLALSTLDSLVESSSNASKTISTFRELKKFSFDVGILAIFGELDIRHREELRQNYMIVEKGYNSFPTKIPGTSYHSALSARKRLGEILKEIIKERKEQKTLEKDLLAQLLNFKDQNGETLTDEQISDNVIGVVFAAQDTTASVLTWVLKFLSHDKKLLKAVQAEQMAIYEANDGGKKCLTWAQTRMMTLTHRVILESLRMSSIISFTFREAVADVEYKGYLIPKGWKVMPLFRNIHHSHEFFPHPQNFDPSRFQVIIHIFCCYLLGVFAWQMCVYYRSKCKCKKSSHVLVSHVHA
ncbi:Abscisic acid 8'-hydroxylase 4, partial [Linum perenne]